MEELLKLIASNVALAVETIAVLIVAFGASSAARDARAFGRAGTAQTGWLKPIWVRFGKLAVVRFAVCAGSRYRAQRDLARMGADRPLGGDCRDPDVPELFSRARSRGVRDAGAQGRAAT